MAKDRYQDLGFAGRAAESDLRLLNHDGSFNVRRRGISLFQSFSFYHTLISMSWWKFNLLILAVFVAMNLIFACLYLAAGLQNLAGMDGNTAGARFMEAFFFSTQTFTTVGYGRISPMGFGANVISAIESLTGLLSFALATGLLYGRFSRPVARIIFSRTALVSTYQNITGFMFRIANERTNQLIDVEATVVVVKLEDGPNGKRVRKFYQLELERDMLNFFHLSWTVVHPIDENSPLYGMTKEQLDYSDAEFLILIRAFDDTFSQTVHTRSSYKAKEVLYGRKFTPIIDISEAGFTEIHLGKIHNSEAVS